MASYFCLLLLLAGLLSPSLAIKCYRSIEANAEPLECPTTGRIVNTAQSGIAKFWKWAKDGIQKITGDDWIDDFGETIKNKIGLDITSHEANKKWVQGTLDKFGLNFDVSGNCIVTFDKSSKATVSRECGALGGAGTFGAEIVQFMQGKQFNFLAGAVCFTKPGTSDQEVCMCSKEGCNENADTAKKSVGINPNARSALCNGEECPLAPLNNVNNNVDFNTACVTYRPPGEDAKEMCYSTEAVLIPEVSALTRSKRSVTDKGATYTLSNVDGEDKPFDGFQSALRGGEPQPEPSSAPASTTSFFLLGLVFGLIAWAFQ